MLNVQGVYTAMVTPFDEKGHINENGFIENIHFQINNGIDGLVILGTTGETPTLTHPEKVRLTKIAIREAKGNVPVMIGTGSYSTEVTIQSTKEAQDLGADCALVVTPYYNKPTQEGLFRHFKAVAESVDIPIFLYNILGRTGQNITTETLQRLSEIPNIIGVKEASGSISQMMEVMDCIGNAKSNFSMLSGDDQLTLPCISIGGRGVISVVSNLVPDLIKELVTNALNGYYAQARQLHYQLMPLFKGAFIETNPIPIKTAMNLAGMPAGPCRLPLCEMSPENLCKVTNVVEGLKITA